MTAESHSLLRRLRRPRGLVAAGALLAALVAGGATATPSDTTPPVITPTISGTKGLNGWYTSDTTVSWLVTDPESIVTDSDCQLATTVRLETKGDRVTCTATSDGGTGEYTVIIKLDKTAPAVTFAPNRPAPDANGWYNHPLDFTATPTEDISGPATCDPVSQYRGPDRANASINVECRNLAGLKDTKTVAFDYDDTAPSIKAVPARRPDRYGWYSRAVRISFAGQDAVSHVAGCSSQMYGHPNSANAAVTGWCEDRAGNRATKTYRFRFASPLLQPRKGMRVSSPPLLDWVGVPRARGYNAQLWHDGRKILSRWPASSQLKLDGSWQYQGRVCRLARGESYTWYIWPRFKHGYGKLLGSSRFAYVRGSSRAIAGLS